MKLPVSWLRDFIDLNGLSVEEISRRLTLAGLEVEEIRYVGLEPADAAAVGQHSSSRREFKTTGIGWDRDKIVVAEVREVMPHPNADRLVLCDLFDGKERHTVLTGAPNLFPLKGQGRLEKPLKVAYAKEGASLYDGHAEGRQLMTLKRTKIRGVDSYSMACSEKELGISDEHEGIILLAEDAPVGKPLADYMGDAVLDIAILPSMARCASVLGVARELAALTGRMHRSPAINFRTAGTPVGKLVRIGITRPDLNPRFVLGLIRDVEIKPSSYEVQRRLKLSGMRPINNIVDATNYAMLELGEPLHAFDYDVLVGRARKGGVRISTRPARAGEKLTTLDGVERTLSSLNVLVCDEAGPLSIAGVMGGAESEVHSATRNVLLEGAAWNFINIRRTAREHNLPSEASFRFSRGVHPALAKDGVRRGLQLMAEWSHGRVAPGLVDEYPQPPKDPVVVVTPADAKRLLGIDLTAPQMVELLTRLEFKCRIKPPAKGKNRSKAGKTARHVGGVETRIAVTVPAHRQDIGEGIVGVANVLEEVARMAGYDRIPETRMADPLPPQAGNFGFEWEERLRDTLVALGLQETIGLRMTSPEKEGRLVGTAEHVSIENPITPERRVLRRSVLASLLEAAETNARRSDSQALFEIGPAFEPRRNDLPNELPRLALVMTGMRESTAWDHKPDELLDFYDMKGRIEMLLEALRIRPVTFEPVDNAIHLHPGKAAQIRVDGRPAGVFGALHPTVKARYDFGETPVIAGELDLALLRSVAVSYAIAPVPEYPAIFEDIAVIVDESLPAERVESLIRESGGEALSQVRLFDLYRGDQVGPGKKSLAYSLTYQAPDRTLTDAEAAGIRKRIVDRLEKELGAQLRS